MSHLTAPHFGDRRAPASAGTPLTREEFIVAARLADHLAAQLKELDERESLLRADLARMLEKERHVLEAQSALCEREEAVAAREAAADGLERAALQLSEAQGLLEAREQEFEQRERDLDVFRDRLHSEQARLEQLTQELRSEQSSGQAEAAQALESARRAGELADARLAALTRELSETQALLESREQELEQRERELEASRDQLQSEQARLEQLAQELSSRQSADQTEAAQALESARRTEELADARLAEIASLREEAAKELEAARLKIIEDRVHFEGECAKLRRRLEDERQRHEQEFDQEAIRLRELREKVEQSAASLDVQRQQLVEDRIGWESERERLLGEMQAQSQAVAAQQQATESNAAERDKLVLERQAAIDEIEKRKVAAKQLLAAQSQALEQLKSDLDRRQAELEQARSEHERNVAQWADAAKSKATKLVAGLEDIRKDKLAGLDLREAELSRREVDFRKRTQLHEQHLEKVRSELKEQRAQLEKKRQQQRVWIEQIEASIRLRMTQLRKFRDLIAAREQALDDERKHVTQMQQSAAYTESQRWRALEALQEDLVAQGEQLRDWFVTPFQNKGSAGAAAAAVAVMLDLIEKRAADLQDILSLLQAQRDQWETERSEAERVMRELVQQLESALDELGRQQTASPASPDTEHEES